MLANFVDDLNIDLNLVFYESTKIYYLLWYYCDKLYYKEN